MIILWPCRILCCLFCLHGLTILVDFEDQHQGMGCADAVAITSSGLKDLSSDFSPNRCGCPMGLRLFRTNPGGKLAPDADALTVAMILKEKNIVLWNKAWFGSA